MKIKNYWIFFTSLKILKGKKKIANTFIMLAFICLVVGCMSLVLTISVMNGLQNDRIESTIELNSYHIRIEGENAKKLINKLEDIKKNVENIRVIYPFIEIQAIAKNDRYNSIIDIRALPNTILFDDYKSAKNLFISPFTLAENDIMIGIGLGFELHLNKNDNIELYCFDDQAKAKEKFFKIKSSFYTRMNTLNNTFAIISLQGASKYLNKKDYSIGIKLYDEFDKNTLKEIKDFVLNNYDLDLEDTIISWQNYNRVIFSALKIEKIFMMILAGLIFLVIAINLDQSFKRFIFRKKKDIAIIKALGASKLGLSIAFILNGIIIGASGGLLGVCLGLLITNNLKDIIDFIFKSLDLIIAYFYQILNKDYFSFLNDSFMYSALRNIKPFIYPSETLLVLSFSLIAGIYSSLASAYKVYKFMPIKVIKEEV